MLQIKWIEIVVNLTILHHLKGNDDMLLIAIALEL